MTEIRSMERDEATEIMTKEKEDVTDKGGRDGEDHGQGKRLVE